MLSEEQIKLLQGYRDKSYITSILCQQSEEHFSFLKSMVNIPLILTSSVMTILNSLNETESKDLKYCNIVLNASTAMILSLIGNFKLTEQSTNFKQIQIKMNKLCHQIEDKLTIDLENTTIENLRTFINEYDAITEQIDFTYPEFIKNRVKKTFYNKKVLPNVLNCDISFIQSNQNNNNIV